MTCNMQDVQILLRPTIISFEAFGGKQLWWEEVEWRVGSRCDDEKNKTQKKKWKTIEYYCGQQHTDPSHGRKLSTFDWAFAYFLRVERRQNRHVKRLECKNNSEGNGLESNQHANAINKWKSVLYFNNMRTKAREGLVLGAKNRTFLNDQWANPTNNFSQSFLTLFICSFSGRRRLKDNFAFRLELYRYVLAGGNQEAA